MALIDVSELLNDPDFIDELSIIRRDVSVNDYGEGVITKSLLSGIYGSIQGATKDDIARLPEGVQLSRMKVVYTKTELKVGGPDGEYSDLIVINNKEYTIENVTPWGNFGSGWYMCDCVALKVSQ